MTHEPEMRVGAHVHTRIMNPQIREFIDRVIVPALLERLTREQQTPRAA